MSEPLRIFIGYDSKEPVAYHVLAHSILTRASVPVSITPLVQSQLRAAGLYTRERGPTESTEFSLTRFLVPYLAAYKGLALFLDCDMLCQADIAELFARFASGAVAVCQHDYTPTATTKFLGQVNAPYPRKNWSSAMLFDCSQCEALTPGTVNTLTGLQLHRFQWLADEQIGALPIEWNWLVGEYATNPTAKLLHYTLGGPWFPETWDCEHAREWTEEWHRLNQPNGRKD